MLGAGTRDFAIYSGVLFDIQSVQQSNRSSGDSIANAYDGLMAFMAFDLPFSFAMDTLLLPISIPVSVVRWIVDGSPWPDPDKKK